MSEFILEIKQICKRFPGVIALENMSFNVKYGEIHAIVGENGAGKSTLMKILSGAYSANEGSFVFDGNTYTILKPKQAIDIGINITNQELSQVPELTIAGNIFLGDEKAWLNEKEMVDRTKVLLDEVGLHCKPDTKIKELSIGTRQLVEVLKATHKSPKLLIMDEPTSSLSSHEISLLFNYIKKLKEKGCTILYISHKLDEILEISDTVTVLRDGKHVATLPTADCTQEKLIFLMVNRNFSEIFPEVSPLPANSREILRVNVVTRGKTVNNCSFYLRSGEVFGFTGLIGAGRTELMRILFGVDKKDAGEIFVNGKKVSIHSPKEAMKVGMGFVTEDRRKSGFIPMMSVRDNITLPSLRKLATAKVFTHPKKEGKIVEKYIKRFSIKTPSVFQYVMNLSGGNQQKVILSKWMLADVKILIMDEPTRGIDVNSKREIYNLINEFSKLGMGVILVSSEINEIIGLCHRTAVMCEGKITGEVNREDFEYEKILKLAFERGDKSNGA